MEVNGSVEVKASVRARDFLKCYFSACVMERQVFRDTLNVLLHSLALIYDGYLSDQGYSIQGKSPYGRGVHALAQLTKQVYIFMTSRW